MKLAILIMAHRLPKQVALLCNCLMHNDIDIFIHIDKKRPLAAAVEAARLLNLASQPSKGFKIFETTFRLRPLNA